jgi:beta-glucanase (GH16 family)
MRTNLIARLRGVFVLACFLFYGVFASAQCPTVVWGDEFNATSLDLTKWSYQIGDGCQEGICGWGNNELQYYKQENVTLSNGQLHITAKRERVQSKSYTSGRLRTINKGDWTFGRFEANIKLPAGQGLWPAFWMLPTDETYGGWPQSGEIDIMEFVAADPTRVLGTIHYGDPYPNNKNQGGHFALNSGGFPDAFHTFAIEWEPGIIRWFVDDILYLTKTSQDLSPYNWPFDQRFHFLLNVAVGGNLGGAVDNGIFPKTMDVEYVRVYDGFKPYITGDRSVANQESGVTYNVGNLANGTSVTWTVPTGATIVSGQGTTQVSVNFGNTSGNVMATFSTPCGSQQLTLPVQVEPPYTKDFSFENFDEPATVSLNTYTGTLTEVSNPAPGGVNTSALVGRYVRNSSQQYDVLVYNVSNITDANQYSSKTRKFYMDVYTSAPLNTEILLQLETATATPSNYPTGRHSRYVGKVLVRNQWQRMVFELLDKPDGTASSTGITKMILLFASNSFTGDTYHYDNLDSYSTGSTSAPTYVFVSSLTTGTASAGGGSKFGTATITVRDDFGNPVPNTTVTGTFSGTFSETKSGVTGSNGSVTLTTTAKAKGTVVVNFCVTNLSHGTLPYNSSANTITCTGGSALMAENASDNEVALNTYPNPFDRSFTLTFTLTRPAQVGVTVMDGLGRAVDSMESREYPKGDHSLKFENELKASGLYFVKVNVDGKLFMLKQVSR